MEYVGGTSLNDLVKRAPAGPRGAVRAVAGRPGDRLPRRGAPGVLVPARRRPAVLRLQAGQRHPGRRERQADRPRRRAAHRRRRHADLRHRRASRRPRCRATAPRIASDIYTVGRTLAVLVFEFRGSTGEYVDRLPTPEQVPLFAEHDSLYRLLLRATATAPEDRFQSADELREQLLGVLREVTSRVDGDYRSVPSSYFETPAISGDELGWADLPRAARRRQRPDGVVAERRHVRRPGAPAATCSRSAPEQTAAVRLARAAAALGAGDPARARAECEALLQADPWDWRAVWMTGVAALGRPTTSPERPPPSTPSTASCPASWRRSWRWPGRASWPARRDLAGAPLRGVLARPTAPTSRRPSSAWPAWPSPTAGRDDALAALARIPPVSRAYGESRRQRASLLVGDGTASPDDLAAASVEVDRAGLPPRERTTLQAQILEAALAMRAGRRRRSRGTRSPGCRWPSRTCASRSSAPTGQAARLTDDRDERIAAGRPGQRRAAPHADMSDGGGDDHDVPDVPRAGGGRRRVLRVVRRDARPGGGRRWREPRSPPNRRPPPARRRDDGVAPAPARRAAGPTSTTGSARRAAQAPDLARPLHRGTRPTGSPASATRASCATATRTRWRWRQSAQRAVLVVCDGVTSAPDSDRASLAAAKAARDVLTAAAAGPAGPRRRSPTGPPSCVRPATAANREAVAVARLLGDPPEPPSCTFVAAVAEDGMVVTRPGAATPAPTGSPTTGRARAS